MNINFVLLLILEVKILAFADMLKKTLRNHELKAGKIMKYFNDAVKQNEDGRYHRFNMFTEYIDQSHI